SLPVPMSYVGRIYRPHSTIPRSRPFSLPVAAMVLCGSLINWILKSLANAPNGSLVSAISLSYIATYSINSVSAAYTDRSPNPSAKVHRVPWIRYTALFLVLRWIIGINKLLFPIVPEREKDALSAAISPSFTAYWLRHPMGHTMVRSFL